MTLSRRRGFTLIELLIVITIIGILAVALVPRISQGPARARDVARKADLTSIANALELYFADNNQYPAPGSGNTECISKAGETVNLLITPMMKSGAIPTDPGGNGVTPCVSGGSGSGYGYNRLSPTSYILAGRLETDSATGEGIYCKNEPTDSTVTMIGDLILCDGTMAGTPHWYVIYQ